MSDKSFGDHANRNIVKNPLLSSAVTGLSIEDLTHNAVLLPAVSNQDLNIIQDKQAGDPVLTLGDSSAITNIHKVDPNFNISLSDINYDNHNVVNTNQFPNSTLSKASHKSDDFDVNEYFARLQGTRYVSAPVNSCLQDNLQSEENLEEINLNDEKEKDITDGTQHSITSDIAQNFSQLPTVLPQVASVVFSSFSSMLNLKSREQTPDDAKDFYNAPVAQPHTQNLSVPLNVPETQQVTAPPPLKEPPTTGIPSYRISTKKKVYAQIPGLSCDYQNVKTYPPNNIQTPPSYFIPDINTSYMPENTQTHHPGSEVTVIDSTKVDYNIPFASAAEFGRLNDIKQTQEVKIKDDNIQLKNSEIPPITQTSVQQMPVIPPPPMFSNLPRKDNQSSIEKTILPPSVARRIGANQPIIKQTPPPSLAMHDIFVPTVTENISDNNVIFEQNVPNAPMRKEDNYFSNIMQPIAGSNSSETLMEAKPYGNNIQIQNLNDSSHAENKTLITDMNPPAFFNPMNLIQSDKRLEQDISEITKTYGNEVNMNQMQNLNDASHTEDKKLLPDLKSPTFFNPMNRQSDNQIQDTSKSVDHFSTQNVLGQYFSNDATNEIQKPVTLPPKSSINVNYRMAKKKPQYYSGPIEGVGNISNNVVPKINPVVERPSVFEGTLFTPNQETVAAGPVNYDTTNYMSTETTTAAFDVNKISAQTVGTFNVQQEPNYNTAFDLSRPTTESYEHTQETKGFGIIGSLKSKLSSIDINKIQNTVTTFFDPEFNNTKGENKTILEDSNQYQSGYQHSQNLTNVEIFVPNIDQKHTNPIPYNQTFGNICYSGYNDLGQNTTHSTHQHVNYNTPSYHQGWYNNQHYPVSTAVTNYNIDNKNETSSQDFNQQAQKTFENYNKVEINTQPESTNNESKHSSQATNNSLHFFDQSTIKLDDSNIFAQNLTTTFHNRSNEEVKRLDVDTQYLTEKNEANVLLGENIHGPTNVSDGWSNIIKTEQEIMYSSNDEQKSNLNLAYAKVDDTPSSLFSNEQFYKKENFEKDADKKIKPVHFFKSTPYLDIKDPVTSPIYFSMQQSFEPVDHKQKEQIENKNILGNPLSFFEQKHSSEDYSVLEDSEEINIIEPDISQLNDGISVEFIENQVSELNICETCREVNKTEPEEKEVDDLTKQMIENITAPIQLSNPVAAASIIGSLPLLESSLSETPIPPNIIENIKPVIDLLEDDSPVPSYGWSTDNTYASQVLKDHSYNIQTDSNTIGFFQNKSLSFEDIPKNASDEIKAGLQNSQDEYSSLIRQFVIPTAPPGEEIKSDEGGLDVHSIEQDAKNDFPIYGDFTLEPSETDDDKIEIRERTKSIEEHVHDADSFTNRVEKFKLMETSADSVENVFDVPKDIKSINIPVSTSPAITIASYFDTGNYAAETHYKNSLTSPTTISAFNADFYSSTSIPPGFEEEYKRKLSNINQNLFNESNVPNIPFIPDTTTQTPVSTVITTGMSDINKTIYDSEIKNIEKKEGQIPFENERLPAFANLIKSQTQNVATEKPTLFFRNSPTNDLKTESLEDPINFFSPQNDRTATTTEQSDAYNSFNRLSSYFTTPSTSDHSKSFFELSQSQNHYRHKHENKPESINNHVTNFFQQNKINDENIPDNYLANMNLINDLTSTKYYNPKDIVTTVNYCTVEYDKCVNDAVGEPEIPLKHLDVDDNKNISDYNKGDLEMVGNAEQIIKNCKTCCDLTAGIRSYVDINTKDFKVNKRMDTKFNSNTNYQDNNKNDNKNDAVTVKMFEKSVPEERNEESCLMAENRATPEHTPLKHHWFYQYPFESDEKYIWRGFSMADSQALENAYQSPNLNETTFVPTDGGRYDVNVMGRLRVAVYWPEKPTNVIRCSWFYKGTTDGRYVPYSEAIAELLEEEYLHGLRTGEWHRRLMLPNNVVVVMHGPSVMVHFQQNDEADLSSSLLAFSKIVYRNPPKIKVPDDQPKQIDHLIFVVHGAGEYRNQRERNQSVVRTWVVRRGCDDSEIDESEPPKIDHLLLLCHGVGSACDMRLRPVEKVVNDFRFISLQLIQSHYKSSYESGVVGRVEVLPISWHSKLHSGETGVDRRLAAVTLESIPRLRSFTNDTILDVLFYTSPVFCQTIVDTVCSELNRIYKLFRSRNPDFKGGVSLGGHSLGSVILYDLLCHQLPRQVDCGLPEKRYVTGTAGTGQPMIKYPSLEFSPDSLYALGSPIAIFECIRGVDILGQQFHLPTCKNFFNIFHPYDPIAYRIEPMINPILRDVKPLLIPHHKGRKRMHLELRDTMARVGADLKQRVMETIKSTWSHVWKSTPPPTDQQLEKVVEEELEKEHITVEETQKDVNKSDVKQALPEMLGQLNGGRRIDHVLQEAPFEMINEYIFAMRSHVCYWESEDTMLLMLREIYDSIGIQPDSSVPQQNMTVHRTRTISEDKTAVSAFSDSASTSKNVS